MEGALQLWVVIPAAAEGEGEGGGSGRRRWRRRDVAYECWLVRGSVGHNVAEDWRGFDCWQL